jgi:hypothetical protein
MAGLGHVFWEARLLEGQSFDLGSLPGGVTKTTFYGPLAGAISGDTAAHGDFDGDGVADLAICSPCDDPLGRVEAGTVHVLYGNRFARWPALVDLAAGSLPSSDLVEIAEIYGANGLSGGDRGDTLCYSAATGDVDGDNRVDLIVNEMRGNGALGGTDVGNLIVVPGSLLDRGIRILFDDFESGATSAWSVAKPASPGGDEAAGPGPGAASTETRAGSSKRGADGRGAAPRERPVEPPPRP